MHQDYNTLDVYVQQTYSWYHTQLNSGLSFQFQQKSKYLDYLRLDNQKIQLDIMPLHEYKWTVFDFSGAPFDGWAKWVPPYSHSRMSNMCRNKKKDLIFASPNYILLTFIIIHLYIVYSTQNTHNSCNTKITNSTSVYNSTKKW